jgi:hypothetical protein
MPLPAGPPFDAPPLPPPVGAGLAQPAQPSNGPIPCFREPHKFNGKANQVSPFINEIDTAVLLQGRALPSNEFKANWMSLYLGDGDPISWWYAVKADRTALLYDFATFKTEFITHFGDSDLPSTALHKSYTIAQSGSCANYVSCLRELFPYLQLTDQIKLACFKNGIKSELCMLMAAIYPQPTTFGAYAAIAIKLDNELHNARTNSKHSNKSASGKSLLTVHTTVTYTAPHATITTGNSNADVVPMDIDAVKIRGPLMDRQQEEVPL